MRKALLALTLGLGAGAGAAAADPVLGTWQTQPDEGSYAHIEMAPCGAQICGTIARTFNSSGEYRSDTLGKTLVMGMEPAGGGKYNGKVWRPANDKIYIGKMELRGDRLDLSGCVAGGLICKTQTWARVN